MTFIIAQTFSKLSLIYLMICLSNILGENFKKSIFLNKKKYEILGSRLLVEKTTVDYFARIPYAQPPVGDLRFKRPLKIEDDPWVGVYNGTIQPNTCWQAEGSDFDKSNPAAKLWLSTTPMDEDCLYLTIWTPKMVGSKLPVMFWIYGGAFSSGSSTLEVYDGSILASKYGVIVVSIQYRLGPLGFLYLDDTQAPGNQGLLDQLMALQWVKDNIHNFDGDKDRITLFGESAGSASTSLHVLSPISQNLFKRAIMESGSPLAPWAVETKEDSKEKSLMLAKYVDCDKNIRRTDNLINCLKNVKPEKLVTKQFDLKGFIAKQRADTLGRRGVTDLYTDASYFFDLYFRPIYDGYFIPRPINVLIKEANAKVNIELLMGFNANEGMFFLIYGLNKWLKFFNNSKVEDIALLSSSHPNHTKVSKFLLENIASIDMAYVKLLPLLLHEYNIPSTILGWQNWNSTQVLSALDQLTGDQQFVCPVIDFAENMAQNNRKIYLYYFQHRTEKMTFPVWTGTMHGYEIEYVFGMPFQEKFKRLYYSFTQNERKLSDYVMTMWTNFAKFGNPTNVQTKYFNEMVSWPTYNSTDKLTFVFSLPKDNLLRPVRISEKSRKCKFWNKVLPSITSMLNSGRKIASFNLLEWINILVILSSMWITGKLL